MALFVDQCHLIGDAKQVIGGAITRDSGDDWCQTDDRPPASGRKPEQEDRQTDADAYHLFSFAHIVFHFDHLTGSLPESGRFMAGAKKMAALNGAAITFMLPCKRL